MAAKPKITFLQPVHQCTWPVLQKSFAKYGFSASDILTNWRAIVGDELAARAIPHRISWPRSPKTISESLDGHQANGSGTLVVRAEDGPSAVEIQHLELEIIERINVFYGYSAIGRLKVIQGSLGFVRLERPKKRKQLSNDQARHLESLIETTLNGPLSEALNRLGRGVYSKSK